MENDKDEVQLRVAVYLRVSTEEQADKYGLDAQRASIEGMIKSKGKLKDGRDRMVLAGKNYEYVDDGISGTTKMEARPEFARLKEDIMNSPDNRPFDMVAVYRIDRFARKLRILMDILNFFEEKDIEFISATESIDTSTPFGRAMLGIMGVIAELELETIKSIPLLQSDLLIERKMPSIFLGKSTHDPEIKPIHQAMREHFYDPQWHHSDEENFADLISRVKIAFDLIHSQKKENIAVVTHGYFLTVMIFYLLFGELADPRSFKSFRDHTQNSNSGLTLCEHKGDKWKLLTWNDYAHLGD